MKYYRTYKVVVGVFAVVFTGIMGTIWHFSKPLPVDAAPVEIVSAEPVQAEDSLSESEITPEVTSDSRPPIDVFLDSLQVDAEADAESLQMDGEVMVLAADEQASGDYRAPANTQQNTPSNSQPIPVVIEPSSSSSTGSTSDSSLSSSSLSGGGTTGSSASLQGSEDSISSTPLPIINNPPISGGASFQKTILEQLEELAPLPKVHYSWALTWGFLADDRQIAYELGRITHALSIRGEYATEAGIDMCVSICSEINKTNPEIPCFIGVNYSPWHREFRPDLPEGFIPAKYNFTIFNHSTYDDEIEEFVLRMSLVKQWVSQSNQKYKSDVKVGALLLDSERFHRRLYDSQWNIAMGVAFNDIHVKAVEVFPEARIEWYDRGMRTGYNENTYDYTPSLADNAIMTGMSCSLYSPPDRTRMQKLFQETCDLADTYVINGQTPWRGLGVTPWVALAWGYDWNLFRLDTDPSLPQPDCYRQYWDYNLRYSRQIGAELNSFAPPYDRAEIIVFFPRPFFQWNTSRGYDVDSIWGKHFVEYCKGAAQANN